MPIFDYQCKDCGHEFEILIAGYHNTLIECPDCGASSVKRMVSSNTSFILKGDCWAKDNYSSKKEG